MGDGSDKKKDLPGVSGLSFIPERISSLHAMLALAIFSQALFLIGVQHPAEPFFDETHYVPASRDLIRGLAYVNVEHPLFAKFLIGLSMTVFGDTPFGWRFLGTIMGSATVVAVFLITQTLFKNVKISLVAGLLTSINQLVFIQSRIAMLDVYMGAFVLFGIYLFLDSFGHLTRDEVRKRLIGSGALFGLAIGCKWAAGPYLLLAAASFYLVRDKIGRKAGIDEEEMLQTREIQAWRGVTTIEGLQYLLGVGAAVYLATFIPALFVEQNRLAVLQFIPQQLEIYRQQTQALSPHPYMSDWQQWPLIGRPIWYLYERVDGVLRGVLLVGNPAIMWGGLIAVALCARRGWRTRDPQLLIIAGLFVASYSFWILLPKNIAFYYYYYLPAIFLSPALAVSFDRFCRRGKSRWVPPLFLLLSGGLFAYFYPIIAALPLAEDMSFLRWIWFDSWR